MAATNAELERALDEIAGANVLLSGVIVSLIESLPQPLRSRVLGEISAGVEGARTAMLNDGAWSDAALQGFEREAFAFAKAFEEG